MSGSMMPITTELDEMFVAAANAGAKKIMFLYNTVTRTEKPKSSGINSGGSSTHVSSSGRTHGGGGGKF